MGKTYATMQKISKEDDMRVFNCAARSAGIIGALGILTLAGGCGGGNSSPATLWPTPPGLTTLPSGTTSTISSSLNMQSGDEWFYAVNGAKQTGTTTVHITQARYDRTFSDGLGSALAKGAKLISSTDSTINEKTDIAFDNGVKTSTNLITFCAKGGFPGMGFNAYDVTGDTMDASGNIEATGNDPCDGSQFVPLVPLTWNLSTSITGGAAFNIPDGSFDDKAVPPQCPFGANITNQEAASLTVTAQETVTVPAGTFQTFRVTEFRHYVTQGLTINTTSWWAPHIGSFVKAQSTWEQTTTGETGNYVYQLLAFKAAPAD